MWQDILMMAGGFGFAIALIPSVRSTAKPIKSTCLITGAILTCYVVAMATLGLVLSAIGTGLTAVLWWVLLFQKRGE